MTSVDARMTDALENLRGLIAEGKTPEQAIAEIACESGFSIPALATRARKRFGELENLRARLEAEAAPIREKYNVKSIISEYALLDDLQPAKEWLAVRLGRTPTDQEKDEAIWRAMERWLSKHVSTVD